MIFYLNIWCLCASEISNGIDPGAQAHGTHAICIHLSCWISMFGRVKSGTINASQLFFQGSHVFSILNLRIHACNKNNITTFYRWQWKYLTALSSAVKICSIRRSQFRRQMWDQAQNHQKKQIQWTRWAHVIPSAFYSFHLISFNPNFKRPIPAEKLILWQQVRIPLNIPKHSTKISCQCTNPFRHLARATPKTTRKLFRGHGRRCRPRPPWPPRRSAARPRRRGLRQPPDAAPSSLGAEDATRKAGLLRLPSRNKA